MPDDELSPDFSLFFEIIRTFEKINAPYMVIGAFAATLFGTTRTTYDVDMIVNLGENHIEALAAEFPPPRYYADPEQMRSSIRMGIMFNIIDSQFGSKADLIPLTMEPRYAHAFDNRVRQTINLSMEEQLDIWCARPEDIILGKLMAWAEGRSRKHETDIYEMMVFHYLELDPSVSAAFDEDYIDQQAQQLGDAVDGFWRAAKRAAREEAKRHQ